jgi:hypothetical protein
LRFVLGGNNKTTVLFKQRKFCPKRVDLTNLELREHHKLKQYTVQNGSYKILTGEGVRERVVERGVCTNEPFLEFLWWDGNLRTLHGVWNS